MKCRVIKSLFWLFLFSFVWSRVVLELLLSTAPRQHPLWQGASERASQMSKIELDVSVYNRLIWQSVSSCSTLPVYLQYKDTRKMRGTTWLMSLFLPHIDILLRVRVVSIFQDRFSTLKGNNCMVSITFASLWYKRTLFFAWAMLYLAVFYFIGIIGFNSVSYIHLHSLWEKVSIARTILRPKFIFGTLQKKKNSVR